MENDYKVVITNEYFNKNHYSGLRWFILVTFDNGDKLKIPCKQYDSLNNMKIEKHINKHRLKKRKEKINKIKCRIN